MEYRHVPGGVAVFLLAAGLGALFLWSWLAIVTGAPGLCLIVVGVVYVLGAQAFVKWLGRNGDV